MKSVAAIPIYHKTTLETLMKAQDTHIQNHSATFVDEGLKTHMAQVYREMAIALSVTGGVAYLIGRDLKALMGSGETLLPNGLLSALYSSPLIYAVIFAPLIMVFFMGGAMRKADPSGARNFLYAFAGVFGLSLATIFMRYTDVLIAQAFFATAAGFAGLSLWGYTTKRDISGWGSFLFIGLIGVIVVSIVNLFVGSGPIQMALSLIAVFIFAGFTAYDTQNIKNNYLSMRDHMDDASLAKMGTMGALSLFIDFVGLFQNLLHLMGMSTDD
jgi:uncharacterized protein